MLPRYARVLAGVFLLACLIVLPPVHAGATTLTVSNCNDSGTGSLPGEIALATGRHHDHLQCGLSERCGDADHANGRHADDQ